MNGGAGVAAIGRGIYPCVNRTVLRDFAELSAVMEVSGYIR